MAADEERREAHVDMAELKNLQTIVLDLEELKKLQSIAKRPRVRSLLSREISNLQAKIVSNSTISDEEAPEEDTGKVKVPYRPAVRKCPRRMCKRVIKRQSVQKTQRKLSITIGDNQLASSNLSVPAQLAETAEEETVPSDNGTLAIGLGETIDIRTNQVLREGSSLQTQVPEVGLKRNRKEIEEPESSMMKKKPKFTNIQQTPVINGSICGNMEEEPNQQSIKTITSEHVLQERTDPSDVNEASHAAVVVTESACVSNKTNHTMPSRTTVAASKSRLGVSMRRVTDGGSCESMQEEPNKSLQTKTSDKVVQEKANRCDMNEACPMAVVVTESADVSDKTSQTMQRGYVLIGTDQQQMYQTTTHKKVRPSSSNSGAASGSRRRKSWCYRCRAANHGKSECDHLNRTCFRCHENGHFWANCPNVPQNTIHPSGMTATASGNTVEHALLNEEPREETDSMPTKNGVDLMQASGSRQKRSWCRRCRRLVIHAESECDLLNQTCFICHGKGHFKANCPNAPQNTIRPDGLRAATAGENTSGACTPG